MFAYFGRPITVLAIAICILAVTALVFGPVPDVTPPHPLTAGATESENIDALIDWIGATSLIDVRDSKSSVVNQLEVFRELSLADDKNQASLSALILATHARGFPGQSLSFIMQSRCLDIHHVANRKAAAAILGLAATEPLDAIRLNNHGLNVLELRHAAVDRAEAAVRLYPGMPYLRAVASACNISLYRQSRMQMDQSGSASLMASIDHAMAGFETLAASGVVLKRGDVLPELAAGMTKKWSSYEGLAGKHSDAENMSCLLLLGNYLESVSWYALDNSVAPETHAAHVIWALDLVDKIRAVIMVGLELGIQLDLDEAAAANVLACSNVVGGSYAQRAAASFTRAVAAIAATQDCRTRTEYIGQTPLYAGLDMNLLICK